MSDLVSYSLADNIATITLNNGKVNVLSSAMFAALNEALDQAEADKAVVMLVGKPGIFSAGYDLKELMQGQDAIINLIRIGSTFTRRLLAHPFPVVSVCTGNAIAKGAFILLASDYRIGVQGDFKIGLNETQIGMIMHHAGIELGRQRLTPAAFNRCVINAEMVGPEEAVQLGFLDKAVPAEALMAAATAEAKRLAGLKLDVFAATKVKARKALLDVMDAGIEQDALDGGAQ